MNAPHHALASLRRRLLAVLFLSRFGRLAAVWSFAWGLAVLVLRTTTRVPRGHLLAGALGFLACGAAAAAMAWRRRPRTRDLLAVLDSRNRCGGLLMSRDETDASAWLDALAPVRPVAVRWQGRRHLRPLAAALLFVAGALVVPSRPLGVARGGLEVSAQVDGLRGQAEALAELDVLTDEQAARIDLQLARTLAEADGRSPARAWETLDHVEQSLRAAASEAALTAASRAGTLAAAEQLATELLQHAAASDTGTGAAGAATNDAALAAAASDEFGALLRGGLLDATTLAQLDPALQAACQAGSLTPEQLRELAAALAACGGALSTNLAQLCSSQLLDPRTLAQCQGGMGGCTNGAALAALLAQQGDGASALAQLASGRPGSGSISRGRGDAAMTWRDPASEEGTAFREQVLSPAALDPAGSRLTAVTRSTPTPAGEPLPAEAGALAGAAASGGSAQRQALLPRHRAAVRRYFEGDPP